MSLPGSAISMVAWSACLAMIAACASSTRGRDQDRVFPTLRAVFDLNEPAAEGERSARFRHGLEVEVSGTAGEFELSNGVGATDYEVLHGSVAYRFGLDARRVQIFGLLGFGIDRIDLSDNPTLTVEESYFGPMVGVEGRVAVRDWVAPYVRLSAFVMEQGSQSTQFEAGLAFTAFERTDWFVAFRRWHAEYGNAASFGRNLDLEWRGVVLGFGVRL